MRRGFTLIELMIVIAIIAIIAAIAIPNLLQARKSGNEASALGSLKTITTVQAMFKQRDPDNDGPDYATLNDLLVANYIDSVLGSGTKSGYVFQVAPSADPLGLNDLWWATADPSSPGTTGDRYFAIGQGAAAYYSITAPIAIDPITCVIPPVPPVPGTFPVGK